MISPEKIRKISRILLAIYFAAVLALCFLNLGNLPDLGPTLFGIEIDKIVHFLMFMPLPALFYLSFEGRPAAIIGASVLAGISLAGTTELIQGYLTYRSMDLVDFYADLLGLLSGAILTGAIVAIKKK